MRISDWSSDVCSSDLPLRLADHIADGPHFNARTKIGGEEPIELDEMGAGRRSVRRCGKCLGDIGAAQRRGHDEDALHEVGSLTDRAYLRFDLGLSSAAGQARYCRGRALVAIGSCP